MIKTIKSIKIDQSIKKKLRKKSLRLIKSTKDWQKKKIILKLIIGTMRTKQIRRSMITMNILWLLKRTKSLINMVMIDMTET